MKKSMRLDRILSMFITASIVIPLLVISIFAMNYSRSFLVELSKSNNRQIVENLKANVEVFFVEPQHDLNILRDILVSKSTKTELEDLFAIYHVNQKQFSHYLIVNDEGRVEYSYPAGESIVGFDYSNANYYKAIKGGAEEFWSPTYVDTKYNEISVDYALPLDDKVLIGTIHLEKLRNILNSIINEEGLIVGITDHTGVYILHSDYAYVEQRFTDPYVNQKDLNYEQVFYNNDSYFGTIIDSDFLGWHIVLYEPVSTLNDKINSFIVFLTIIIIISVVAVVLIGNQLTARIIKNLSNVVHKTKEVAEGEYGIEIEKSQFDEFNEIGSNFMHMAKKIQSRETQILKQSNEIELMNQDLEKRVSVRTNELTQANIKLEETIENLETTKAQLVESEKLASLGNLIAGLSHEINTPLGIILTTITYMKEETETIQQGLINNKLKKDDLKNFIGSQKDSEELIYSSITKATNLVNSFKLISSDQNNTENRLTNMCEYVGKIILSIEAHLENAGVLLNIDCDPDIEIVTNTRALYEVVVNLILNAVLHAYNQQGGTIDIHIHRLTEGISLIVEDYGSGINDENLKHIFEPFFTTTRGAGGTGLGLNITYNTVRQKLNGNIRCESEIGVGTKFIIELPSFIEE